VHKRKCAPSRPCSPTADRIAHGNLACIDRFNLLAQILATLDGHRLPIGEWDTTDSDTPAA